MVEFFFCLQKQQQINVGMHAFMGYACYIYIINIKL